MYTCVRTFTSSGRECVSKKAAAQQKRKGGVSGMGNGDGTSESASIIHPRRRVKKQSKPMNIAETPVCL